MPTPQPQKEAVVRSIWLSYFNLTLKEQGISSEEEYQRMNHLIWKKYPAFP